MSPDGRVLSGLCSQPDSQGYDGFSSHRARGVAVGLGQREAAAETDV